MSNPFDPDNMSEMDRWELVATGIEGAQKDFGKGDPAGALLGLISAVSILYNFVKPPSARKVAD